MALKRVRNDEENGEQQINRAQYLKEKSWNRKVEQSTQGNYSIFASPAILRKKIDNYFEEAEYPSFTGLALALQFESVKHWEQIMEAVANKIREGKAGDGDSERLTAWNKARSRIQLHYEEGIQSGIIPAQVGRFVLEVLGFQPEEVTTQRAGGSAAAADAARKGYAQALKDMSKTMPPKAKKAVINDATAAESARKPKVVA